MKIQPRTSVIRLVLPVLIVTMGAALAPEPGRAATIWVPDDFALIQAAIDAASNGDHVVVRPGTYYERLDFKGKSIVLRSEQGPAATVIDAQDIGTAVQFSGGETESAVLTGFTITNARFSGIVCLEAQPLIIKNIIAGNRRLGGHGGGIYCGWYSAPQILYNEICGNSLQGVGGGIGLDHSEAVIKYNRIHHNVASSSGGGINSFDDSRAEIAYNIVHDNEAGFSGGGIAGGEIVKNNLIVGNRSEDRGGGAAGCSVFVNNTVCLNCAGVGGGIIISGTLVNNIIRDNTADLGSEFWGLDGATFSFCNVKGGAPGVGNIDADPLFQDPANLDYRLRQDPAEPGVVNPCVDAGDPTSEPIEGSTRTDGYPDTGVVDMGYHYTGDIHLVPFHKPTIQQAIDAAADWETVAVFPGVYAENLDFGGKAIKVVSDAGPESTIVDGMQIGSVVVFDDEESEYSVLEGFTLTNGTAVSGGGICCDHASPRIQRNIVTGNHASSKGGGICLSWSEAVLSSNIITANTADSGGGMYCGSDVLILNCTISNNTATEGGGIHFGWSDAAVWNTIVWGNQAPSQPELVLQASYPSISYCNIGGSWPGPGNIDADPEFRNPLQGDYRLKHTSPCVDAGYSGAPSIGESDFEGDQRIRYWSIDIGADELKIDHLFVVPDLYPRIQQAIDDALDEDLVQVRPGIYQENINFLGKKITVQSTAGPELTIIDGMKLGSVVTFNTGEKKNSKLTGFTLINGSGNDHGDGFRYGGGIDCNGCNPTISGCLMMGNEADYGGGAYLNAQHMTFEGNTIRDNSVWKDGGGVYASGYDIRIIDNRIQENQAARNGGGVVASGGVMTLSKNEILENSAVFAGGGAYLNMTDSEVSENIISGNISVVGDGGAGIDVVLAHDLLIADNVVVNNNSKSAEGVGGVSFVNVSQNPESTIINCTIADNSKVGVCGGFFGSPSIVDSIIWNNGGDELSCYVPFPLVEYCDVKGGYPGVGNINADPLFSDPAAGDYHLTAESPCINKGNDYSWLRPEDFEGDLRAGAGGIDIGADEFRHHLYRLGVVEPGAQIQLAIVGPAGTSPVYLLAAGSYTSTPQATQYGDLYLTGSIRHWSFGAIPSTGILKKTMTVPLWWAPGREFPFQALIGPAGDESTVLSNLLLLDVEE